MKAAGQFAAGIGEAVGDFFSPPETRPVQPVDNPPTDPSTDGSVTPQNPTPDPSTDTTPPPAGVPQPDTAQQNDSNTAVDPTSNLDAASAQSTAGQQSFAPAATEFDPPPSPGDSGPQSVPSDESVSGWDSLQVTKDGGLRLIGHDGAGLRTSLPINAWTTTPDGTVRLIGHDGAGFTPQQVAQAILNVMSNDGGSFISDNGTGFTRDVGAALARLGTN